MADQKGQPKKGGRNVTTSVLRKKKYLDYKVGHLREKHKILRILRSSGKAEAEKYAGSRALLGFLASLEKG